MNGHKNRWLALAALALMLTGVTGVEGAGWIKAKMAQSAAKRADQKAQSAAKRADEKAKRADEKHPARVDLKWGLSAKVRDLEREVTEAKKDLNRSKRYFGADPSDRNIGNSYGINSRLTNRSADPEAYALYKSRKDTLQYHENELNKHKNALEAVERKLSKTVERHEAKMLASKDVVKAFAMDHLDNIRPGYSTRRKENKKKLHEALTNAGLSDYAAKAMTEKHKNELYAYQALQTEKAYATEAANSAKLRSTAAAAAQKLRTIATQEEEMLKKPSIQIYKAVKDSNGTLNSRFGYDPLKSFTIGSHTIDPLG